MCNVSSFSPNNHWNSGQPLVDHFVYQVLSDLFQMIQVSEVTNLFLGRQVAAVLSKSNSQSYSGPGLRLFGGQFLGSMNSGMSQLGRQLTVFCC